MIYVIFFSRTQKGSPGSRDAPCSRDKWEPLCCCRRSWAVPPCQGSVGQLLLLFSGGSAWPRAACRPAHRTAMPVLILGTASSMEIAQTHPHSMAESQILKPIALTKETRDSSSNSKVLKNSHVFASEGFFIAQNQVP